MRQIWWIYYWTVKCSMSKKWSFEGCHDAQHVCQLNCATGPLSGHLERSNKHACECWSDCSRDQDDLRTNEQMWCLHMHNNWFLCACV